MLNIHETVYPRFKSNISTNELENLYTPSIEIFLFVVYN